MRFHISERDGLHQMNLALYYVFQPLLIESTFSWPDGRKWKEINISMWSWWFWMEESYVYLLWLYMYIQKHVTRDTATKKLIMSINWLLRLKMIVHVMWHRHGQPSFKKCLENTFDGIFCYKLATHFKGENCFIVANRLLFLLLKFEGFL